MKVYQSEKCFGIAGKAWAAIKGGEVVEVISMGGHTGCYNGYSQEAQERAGVTRCCRSAVRAAEEMNAETFLKYREKSRAKLSELGEVVSGVASCGEFVIV